MTTIPIMRLGKLRRKDWESKEKYLTRVNKRLAQVQSEIGVWITNPTKEGILTTHGLEDEKQLILNILELVGREVQNKYLTQS